jgi:hypothetical protein
MPGADFVGVELIGDAGELSDGQQKCVLPSSEAVAGTESMEMNDCFGPGIFAGAMGGVTIETR